MPRAATAGNTVIRQALDVASRAAGRGDWDKAVARLRTAMQALGDDAPPELRHSLAVALVNRANQTADRAMRAFAASPAQPDLVGAFSAVIENYQREQREYKKRQRSPKRLAVRLIRWLVSAAIVLGLILLYNVLAGNSSNAGIGVLRFAGAIIVLFALWIVVELWGRGKDQRDHDGAECKICGDKASCEFSGIAVCDSHADALKLAAQARPRLASAAEAQRVSHMIKEAEADLLAAAELAPLLDDVRDSMLALGALRSRLGLAHATLLP